VCPLLLLSRTLETDKLGDREWFRLCLKDHGSISTLNLALLGSLDDFKGGFLKALAEAFLPGRIIVGRHEVDGATTALTSHVDDTVCPKPWIPLPPVTNITGGESRFGKGDDILGFDLDLEKNILGRIVDLVEGRLETRDNVSVNFIRRGRSHVIISNNHERVRSLLRDNNHVAVGGVGGVVETGKSCSQKGKENKSKLHGESFKRLGESDRFRFVSVAKIQVFCSA
jgi:hypothetical protein